MSLATVAKPSIFTPKTPSRQRDYSFLNDTLSSSPLASPSSSPVSAAQARRRSQYKAHPVSSNSSSHPRQSSRRGMSMPSSSSRHHSATEDVVSSENRRALMRERFRNQCLERAQRDRQRKIEGKRRANSDCSSDGVDETMVFEGSEDEDDVLNDELFGRIMSSMKQKQQHRYRLSYVEDVGDSFDPDLDNITEWENELREKPPQMVTPQDIEEEELAAYVEEYELGLHDLPIEEIFSLSDLEDVEEELPPFISSNYKGKTKETDVNGNEDVDMDS